MLLILTRCIGLRCQCRHLVLRSLVRPPHMVKIEACPKIRGRVADRREVRAKYACMNADRGYTRRQMKRETAAATTTTVSQTNDTTRYVAVDAVVLPPGAVERLAYQMIRPIAATISLLLLGCFSALAYTTNGNGTISTNGSASDVQAAISAASAGSTVLIPAGTFSWSSPVTVSTDISLQGAGLSSTTVACSGDNGLLIISNPTPFACTVSGITFNGSNASGNDQTGIVINTPPLLHDCNFNSNGGYLDLIRFQVNGGVVWNWTFYDNDQNEEAISFKNPIGGSDGQSVSWTSNDTMGMADTTGTANTYVENCTFNEMQLQAMDFDDNSRVVVRYCTFNNSGCTSHGLDTSPYGTRQWEFYNNTFIFSTSGTSMAGNAFPLNLNWWLFLRGGTGVIFNNLMPDISSEQWGNKGSITFTVFNIQRESTYIPCQNTWQAIHQVGQGYSSSVTTPMTGTTTYLGLFSDPVYVWGNTGGTNYNTLQLSDFGTDECGNGLTTSEFIQLNRDVYLGTAKPGYVPYTYPHPLRTGASPAPTPAAPQNLRVVS